MLEERSSEEVDGGKEKEKEKESVKDSLSSVVVVKGMGHLILKCDDGVGKRIDEVIRGQESMVGKSRLRLKYLLL